MSAAFKEQGIKSGETKRAHELLTKAGKLGKK